jgi:serine protease Do
VKAWWILVGVVIGMPAANAGLPETLALVRPGIVAVGTLQKTRRPPSKFLGTGFVVGDGTLIATNAHVVPDVLAVEDMEHIAVFVGSGRNPQVREAKPVAMDVRHDLALLKIEGGPLPALLLGDSARVREGQDIAFTGFPIGTVLGLFPVTHRGIISSITPIAIPAQSGRRLNTTLIKRLRDPFDVFQLDATAYPGNSGSPLFNPRTGKVIGVLNMVFVKESKESVLEKPSGISYAIPIIYLKALLKELAAN